MKSALLAAFVAAFLAPSAQATTLDFEEFAGGGFATRGTSISTQGYLLSATVGDFNSYPVGTVPGVPESGSTSILNGRSPARPAGSGGASFTLTRDGGLAFSLSSLAASEGRNAGAFERFGSDGITVAGILLSGGVVSQTLTFDGIAGDNGATDFQIFALTGFDAISSVSFTGFGRLLDGYSFGIDDIVVADAVVSPVPLPAGLPLLLAGLGVMALAGRRKRAATRDGAPAGAA